MLWCLGRPGIWTFHLLQQSPMDNNERLKGFPVRTNHDKRPLFTNSHYGLFQHPFSNTINHHDNVHELYSLVLFCGHWPQTLLNMMAVW